MQKVIIKKVSEIKSFLQMVLLKERGIYLRLVLIAATILLPINYGFCKPNLSNDSNLIYVQDNLPDKTYEFSRCFGKVSPLSEFKCDFDKKVTVIAGKYNNHIIQQVIKKIGVTVDSNWLGEQGFQIVSRKKGAVLYWVVTGNSGTGVLYGVMELRDRINKEANYLLKENVNERDRPAFGLRMGGDFNNRSNFKWIWSTSGKPEPFLYEEFPEIFSPEKKLEQLNEIRQAQAKLREAIDEANPFGAKVFLLTYEPALPIWARKPFINKHPEAMLKGRGRGSVCPSAEITRKMVKSKFIELFKAFPDLSGIILTLEDGGATLKCKCEKCNAYPMLKRVVDYTMYVRNAIQSVRPDAIVILRSWGIDEDIYRQLPGILPEDVKFMFKLTKPPCNDFAWNDKFSPFFGMPRSFAGGTCSYHTDSASVVTHLCYTGPKQKQRGLKLFQAGLGMWGTGRESDDVLEQASFLATPKVAWDPIAFDPDAHLKEWAKGKFGDEAGQLVFEAMKDTWEITNAFMIDKFKTGTFHMLCFDKKDRGGYETTITQPDWMKNVDLKSLGEIEKNFHISSAIGISENAEKKLNEALMLNPQDEELLKLYNMAKVTTNLCYVFRDYHIALAYHNLILKGITSDKERDFSQLSKLYITRALEAMEKYELNYMKVYPFLPFVTKMEDLAWTYRHHMAYPTFIRTEVQNGYHEIIMKPIALQYPHELFQLSNNEFVDISRPWSEVKSELGEKWIDSDYSVSIRDELNYTLPSIVSKKIIPQIDIIFESNLDNGAVLELSLRPLGSLHVWRSADVDIFLDGQKVGQLHELGHRLTLRQETFFKRYVILPKLQGKKHQLSFVANDGTGIEWESIKIMVKELAIRL